MGVRRKSRLKTNILSPYPHLCCLTRIFAALPEPLALYPCAALYPRLRRFTRSSAALETRTFKLETINRDPVALPEPLALYTPAGLYTLNRDSVALPAAPQLLNAALLL